MSGHSFYQRQRHADDREEREVTAHELYVARLTFQYGPDRAASILAGTDEATNADLAAWRRLGAPR